MLKILPIFLLFFSILNADDKKIEQEENIMTFGLQVSQGSANETLSNKTGSKTYNYKLTGIKILLGQDFDFYNTSMQTSRLQLAYKYSELETDVSFGTVSIGYQENMRYWSFLKNGSHCIYPLASVELGYNALNKTSTSSKGKSVEIDLGVAYLYRDFEFTVALASTYIDWNHPENGIADRMKNYQLAVGMTYRFMDTGR